MIREQIKAIKEGQREWRNFGLLMGTVLAVLGAYLLWRGAGAYPYFFAVSAAFILTGLLTPSILKPIHKAWMTLAILLGWLVTRIVLTILFYVGFTLVALLARLLRKRFLNTRIDPGATSYWVIKKQVIIEKGDYEKQF
ncbi:MAG: hypothetical protein JSW34_12020 [Candidatus Zixiibacteriota bacterium]|nr:MAG: hypothetical protein JSW34_12020 [candidate division Zixibacteria bacterium]